jgi:hypothetical protein
LTSFEAHNVFTARSEVGAAAWTARTGTTPASTTHKETTMTRFNKAAVAVAIAASGLTGGVIGATIMGAGTAAINAAPVATTAAANNAATTAAAAATPAAGTFKSNEDPTHEAGESAAREAAENNGTAGIPQQ